MKYIDYVVDVYRQSTVVVKIRIEIAGFEHAQGGARCLWLIPIVKIRKSPFNAIKSRCEGNPSNYHKHCVKNTTYPKRIFAF
jgi:hypothetical protein